MNSNRKSESKNLPYYSTNNNNGINSPLLNTNNNQYDYDDKTHHLNVKNSKQRHHQLETDRMSIGSFNFTDDLAKRSDVTNTRHEQRRISYLRRHWQEHSDVPFVIGADVGNNNSSIGDKIFIAISWILLVIFFPFSLFFTLKVVQEYERAVIFRLGRLSSGGAKGPGMFIVLPCIETYTKVDMRTVSFDVPPQEALTKDSVTVAVDAVVYYRVFNPVISIANVENSQESTRLLAQTSLRNVLGTNSLADILSKREAVSLCMREILDTQTDHWGIKVERVEIKDVRLPIQLQRAMATEAEATREARAKVIAAEGEHKASRALRDAADVLSESSSAIQLRYLQCLTNIACEKNSTIIFPLPIEVFKGFLCQTKNNSLENVDKEKSTIPPSNPPNPTTVFNFQKPKSITNLCSNDITDL